jgi:hypothetical protein
MTDKRKREPDDKAQSARFVETAQKLGAENGKAFAQALKIVAPPKRAAARPRRSGKKSSS